MEEKYIPKRGREDECFVEVLHYVVSTGRVSITQIQRHFEIGFARVGRIVDDMEELGYISPRLEDNERKVLMTMEQFVEKYGDFEHTACEDIPKRGREDECFVEVLHYVVSTGRVSITEIQRHFEIGFARTARIVDDMEELGYISPRLEDNERKVLMTMEQFVEKYGDFAPNTTK